MSILPETKSRSRTKIWYYLDKLLHGELGTYNNDDETLWVDYLSSISNAKVPAANAPSWTAFGPSGNLFAYSFAEDDFIYMEGFHINHDIKVGSKVYPHVHWTTNNTSTNEVSWEIEYVIAKGHNQEAFGAPTTITLTQAASGTAWQHMIVEASEEQAFTAPEIDSLILMRVKRAATVPTNPNTVFGLYVDLHVEIERVGSKNKSPNFYL